MASGKSGIVEAIDRFLERVLETDPLVHSHVECWRNEYAGTENNHVDPTAIIEHFESTVSHREWIRRTYNMLLKKKILKEDENMHARIRAHDLSKFTLPETVGYAKRFGTKEACGEEDPVWRKSVCLHYAANDHHPQHHEGRNMSPHLALIESVIDMVARRWEKDFSTKDPRAIPIEQLLEVDREYLKRYTDDDRCRVEEILKTWREKGASHCS